MTTLSTIIENSLRVAITAAEEAQRFGHPAVDVEHVFLALLVSETDAGRMLRDRGLGLHGARRAVQTEHAHRLAALGILDVQVPPGSIPTRGVGDIDWNERTLTLFSHSGGDGTGKSLLRSLVADPGGFVAAVLERLGVDPATVLDAAADGHAASAGGGSRTERAGAGPVTYDAFIPAPIEQVWTLLEDPERRTEWDTAIGSVTSAGPGRWTGQAPEELPGTRRRRVPQRARTRSITLVAREEYRLLEWDITFPHTRRRRTERLRVDLSDQPGGTRLHLVLHRPPHTFSIRPVARFLAAGELTRIATGVSRIFRT